MGTESAQGATPPGGAARRPLSPHLQIYRPMYTMVLSILHRGTGLALAVGSVLFAWWLGSVAAGPASFERTRALLGTVPGQLVLIGFTFAFFYHLCNGVRHLAWDLGYGFEKSTARRSGAAVVVASLLLTVAVVLLVRMGGAP
jgi:succinate dehydrogenase / fumarate reductase cytochrome b subunit